MSNLESHLITHFECFCLLRILVAVLSALASESVQLPAAPSFIILGFSWFGDPMVLFLGVLRQLRRASCKSAL